MHSKILLMRDMWDAYLEIEKSPSNFDLAYK
jgi:hypothetical protein